MRSPTLQYSRWFLLTGAAFAAGLVGAAIAGEPVPVERAPQDDSIAAAKQQLDDLKTNARTAPADVDTVRSPSVALPAVPNSGSAEPIAPRANVKAKQQRSANWLVDAMLNPDGSPRRDGPARDGEKPSRSNPNTGQRRERDPSNPFAPSERDAAANPLAPEEPEDAEQAKSAAAATPPASGAAATSNLPNPLAQYSASWLTPQDYALLRDTLRDTSAERTMSTAAAPTDLSAPAPTADVTTILGALGSSPKPAPLSAPADNPYLQGLAAFDSVPTSIPTLSPTAAATMAPSVPSMMVPAPPPEPPKPVIPDFAKPPTDDKYFKPLKRF